MLRISSHEEMYETFLASVRKLIAGFFSFCKKEKETNNESMNEWKGKSTYFIPSLNRGLFKCDFILHSHLIEKEMDR